METLKSTKVDWGKLTVVGFLLVLMALVAALVTWYFMDDMTQKEAERYESQIIELQTENAKLKNDLSLTENVPVGEAEEAAGGEESIIPCPCGEGEATLCPNCPSENQENQR